MIISDKLYVELINLENEIHRVTQNKAINDLQVETFLKNLEKRRFNILREIELYNKTVEYISERIKTISNDYKAEVNGNILKLYIPEPMPSYKNMKTHAFKNILLNLTELTKKYSQMFKGKVFILIKVFDNIKGWDIDNKFIKPIFDSLILNNVIEDDNIEKMFYSVQGEFSNIPHTEVYITAQENTVNLIKNTVD
ncbi:MAG: hypothetical protein UIT70_01265 [Clostridia bacterium]|nr:hypothetical protein [Clostridia bacterium]